MWRIPENAGGLCKERLFSGICSGDASLANRPRHQQSDFGQQLPESSSGIVFWPEDCHETASRWQQQDAVGLSHDRQSGTSGGAVSPSCHSPSISPSSNGTRFFWVGQHPNLSDSSQVSAPSNLPNRALLSQRSNNQEASCLEASSVVSPHCLSDVIDSGCQLPSMAENSGFMFPGLMGCPEAVWPCCDSSPQLSSALAVQTSAASASEDLQDLAPEAMQDSEPFFPASPLEPMSLSDDSDMWAADCPPEELSNLLDWAAVSALPPPSFTSPQLSIPPDSTQPSLQHGMPGVQLAGRQLSCSLAIPSFEYGCNAATTAAQECCTGMPANTPSTHSQLPAADAYAGSAGQLGSVYTGTSCDASSLDTLASDPLELLMQKEQGSCLSCHMGQPSSSGRDSLQRGQDCFLDTRPSVSGRDSLQRGQDCFLDTRPSIDSSPSSAHDDQVNGGGTTDRTPTKRRCGRPRVYDLDRPVDSDAAGAGAEPNCLPKTKGRGAKPKYIYNTAEEAIAKRRKRNRDTATQSYYNRKQRISMLTDEMAQLRATNTALQTVLCILERDPQADRGWVRGQIAAGQAPSSILQELQQTSSWLN